MPGSENIYIVSEIELLAIREAQEEYQKGKFVTDEELQEELKKWLKGDNPATPRPSHPLKSANFHPPH